MAATLTSMACNAMDIIDYSHIVCLPLIVPLKISGNVTHTLDGDVQITFKSNADRMLYDCIVLNDSNTTPAVTPCEGQVSFNQSKSHI